MTDATGGGARMAMRCIARLPDLDGPPVDAIERLDRLARERPGAAAVVTPNGHRTDVATLAAASRALAGALAAGAPQPAIFLGRVGWQYLATSIACLRTGRPFVPIDPDTSPLRLTGMMLTSGADTVVHAGRSADGIALPPHLRMIDADACEEGAGSVAPAPPTPGEAAFVVFTSGSTGVPKGVAQSRASLGSALRLVAAMTDMRAGDRIALVTRGGTIGGPVFGLLGIAVGAGMLLAPDGVAPADLLDMMARERATHLLCYVGFARALCGHPRAAEGFAALRAIQIYGDVIGGADCAALVGVLPPDARIHLLYGSTESNLMAGWAAPSDVDRANPRLPLGPPWPGMEMWLRAPADAGDPAAETTGEAALAEGELCMAGPRVMAGYWRDAAATRACMIPHPDDSARTLFANGDLVRLRPDGMLDFVGRRDNQVKLRGWRIELEEIEAAARRVPGVRAAGVVARRSGLGTVDMLALHVAGTATAVAVEAGLRATLPDHMVPARVIAGGAVPLTPAGKIDRVRLAEIDRQAQEAAARAAAPPADDAWPNALSARIAAAIAEEIDLPSIAPDHLPNDIGIDSLDAVSAALRIEKQFAVSIAPDDLMGTRTMGSIVEEIAGRVRPVG